MPAQSQIPAPSRMAAGPAVWGPGLPQAGHGVGRLAWLVGLGALLTGLGTAGAALAQVPYHNQSICSRAQVTGREYGNLLAAAGPQADGEARPGGRRLIIALNNGLTIQSVVDVDDTTFWSNFAPGHAVDICHPASMASKPAGSPGLRYTLHDSVTGSQVTGFATVRAASGS